MTQTRRTALMGLFSLPLAPSLLQTEAGKASTLILAARARIGVTSLYDPAYVGITYPNGDVPNDRGVCIDVLIRAYRTAFDFDFQKAIHEDMRGNFSTYPTTWGLTRTDRNIDHRRVPNLETWLTRKGHAHADKDWQAGDIMTCRVGRNLPHTGIVTHRRGRDGRYTVIHNIGRGTREESILGQYQSERRFRFLPG